MWRHKCLRLGAWGAGLLVAVGCHGAPAKSRLAAGDRLPDLAGFAMTGDVPATAGKVVVVDLWASWCGPCKISFPAYAKMHQEYAAKGLAIVAVSVEEKKSDYDAFVKKMAPPFVTLLDAKHTLAANIDPPAMPTSYVVGRDGRVRYVHEGYHGAETDKLLRKEIEGLLSEN